MEKLQDLFKFLIPSRAAFIIPCAGKRICCGYDNGVIKMLSLKEGVPLVSLTSGQGHAKAVTCLDTHQENVLLLTGSEDQTAKLINSNSGKVKTSSPNPFRGI